MKEPSLCLSSIFLQAPSLFLFLSVILSKHHCQLWMIGLFPYFLCDFSNSDEMGLESGEAKKSI